MTNLLKFQDDLDDVTKDADLKKECYVILFAREFPEWHSHAGQPTKFVESIEIGRKVHTFRDEGQERIKQCSEVNAGRAYFSLRYLAGKSKKSTQIEFARMYEGHFSSVGVNKLLGGGYAVSVNGEVTLPRQGGNGVYAGLAENDGLTPEQFDSWLFDKSKTDLFGGILLHFTK